MSAADFVASLARPSWQSLAACRGSGPEIFFVERGDAGGLSAGRAFCRRCPVLVECREFAVGDDRRPSQKHGLWGDTSERERRQIRKRRRLAVTVEDDSSAA